METTYTSEGEVGEGSKQQEKAMVEVEKKQMKVMVAIDESDESFHALKWVLDHLFFFLPSSVGAGVAAESELIQYQERGTVILVHVQQPFHYYIFPAGPAVIQTTPLVLDLVRKAQEENSAVLMTRALKLCKERQVRAEAMILDGEPKEMICETVEHIDPTLLVVGSRGRGKIKRAFLGSVSDYCAHHAKCPILIVKPKK